MNMRIRLLCCLLFPLSVSTQSLVNLNFEDETGWQPKRLTQKEFYRTPPGGRGQCAFLAAPFTEHESGYVHQDVSVDLSVATRYAVTAKIRTEGVTGNGAQVYAYGKTKGEMKSYRQSESFRGDTDWTQVAFDLILDPEMDTMRLGCYLAGEGRAWFDDLTFTAVRPKNSDLSPEAMTYLRAFFDTLRTNALHRENIDWSTLEASALSLSAGAQTTSDVYPTLHYILKKVNKHSFMMEPAKAAEMAGADLPDDQPDPDLMYTEGRRINDRIAYLNMPAMGSGHRPTLDAFADSLQGLIATLDDEAVTGWVLDLRNNGGGNCWPMLAGIGPLLGEGVCGYFQAPDGANAAAWSYADGNSLLSGMVQTSARDYALKNPTARIAVLTGPQTASSGEVTTTAFVAHPRARSFGLPTAGYATTNKNFVLSDGATVYLTVSVYADRNNRPVGETIVPDEVIEPIGGKDAALEAAVEWLKRSPK